MFRKNKNSQEFTVSNRTLLRIIGFAIASLVLLQIFENLIHPLTLIFVSFFLSLALNPAVSFVSRKLKTPNRTIATAIAYFGVVSVLILFFSLVLPPLIKQTSDFITDVPQTFRDLNDDEGFIGDFVRNNELEQQVSEFASSFSNDLGSFREPVVTTANRVVSNVVSIITVLVLTFMMLNEGPKWLKLFWSKYPKDKRKYAKKVAGEMYNVVTSYVNGQVLVAAIGATFAIVVLLIASAIFNADGINAIALGGLVFLFSLIPTVGAILSAFVVVLFSLFVSLPLAVTMLIYFIVYQQIENATIQPYIQSKGTELSPMLVFISAILGIGFGGVLGAFVAIPVAGCLKILVEDYFERDSDSTASG